MRSIAVLALILMSSCAHRADLPTYGVVPDFTLTDQTGQPFSSEQLAGHVWVANFIFTSCKGPCPRMSAQFRQIRKGLGNAPSVRFVSFTIDPAHDTPPVLAEYAVRFNADPAHWVFLTGPQPELNRLSTQTFYAGKIDGSLTHSTRFALVDKKGRVRGFYDSSDPEKMEELARGVRDLSKEPA